MAITIVVVLVVAIGLQHLASYAVTDAGASFLLRVLESWTSWSPLP